MTRLTHVPGAPFRVNNGGNGANTSLWKPTRDCKARLLTDEQRRSEEFYQRRAEEIKQLRKAQEAARCGK